MKICLVFITINLLASCKPTSQSTHNEKISSISLDAINQSNEQIQNVYNSIKRNKVTLIINNNIIETENIKTVIDTIDFSKYTMKIDKEKETIYIDKNK